MGMVDLADEAGRVEEAERASVIAAHQARREREARIAESFRPMTPDAELRCLDCEELIGPERLRCMPRASRCTACGEIAAQRLRSAR